MAGGLPDSLLRGTLLTFNCQPGYQLEGPGDSVQCEPSARWSRPVPRCRPVLCARPEHPHSTRQAGQLATWRCKTGHMLLGPDNSTCSEAGVWEPAPPICITVDCGPAPAPAQGRVNYTGSRYRDKAQYSCQPGFTLRGPARRECGPGGNWGGQQPRCVPVTCGPPPSVPLATTTHISTQFGAGETVEFSCQPGHALLDRGGLTCDPAGKWAGRPPHCIPRLCAGPGRLERGNLLIGAWSRQPLPETAVEILQQNITSRRSVAGELVVRAGPDNLTLDRHTAVFYPVGSKLKAECEHGSRLVGPDVNVCEDEDQWLNSFPVCQEIVCPQLENIDHGRLLVEGFLFGQSVLYECEVGYRLVGSVSRTCLASGTWSGTRPTCQPRLCPEPGLIRGGRLDPVTSLEFGSVISYR